MKITVIVPTYCRSKDLARCLEALVKQTRPADEVLVVLRNNDAETWALLATCNYDPLPLHTVTVSLSGQVAALNAGLDKAQGDIIVMTDDDAAPHTDWLERIEAHFLLDDCIGGVGGRDWGYFGAQLYDGAAQKVVGQVPWFGRVIGNHHLGVGPPREVDILKGANMSYRRVAIEGIHFDERLLGTGAQVHNDMAFSLAVKRAGWKLIYDPMVAVDHYQGERFDEDQRDRFNSIAVTNAVHNETLALLEYLPPARRFAFLLWAIFAGSRDARGIFQWFRFLPSEGRLARQKLISGLRGRWQGWQTWRQSTK
jgi:cellulose synthase/poly-beta-1,6-N-acetylglucosamine synthase-like glycosyltransferase